MKKKGNNIYSELDRFLYDNKTDFHFYMNLETSQHDVIKDLGRRLQQRNIYDIAYVVEWTEESALLRYFCERYRGRENYKNSFVLEEYHI